MTFTLGDLLILEIALTGFASQIDLSLHAGQQVQQILGKIEYQISQLKDAAAKQLPLTPPPGPQEPKAGE